VPTRRWGVWVSEPVDWALMLVDSAVKMDMAIMVNVVMVFMGLCLSVMVDWGCKLQVEFQAKVCTPQSNRSVII
jgi:hypothetical protein